MKVLTEFDWVESTRSSRNDPNSISVMKVPSDEEFDRFICEWMEINGRIVRIHTYQWKDGSYGHKLSPEECALVKAMAVKAFLKYNPWQFRVLQQANGDQVEIDWVDIDEWIEDGRYA